MTASQTRIAETIDAFYGEAGTKDNVSAYYRQAVEDLDAETVKELVSLSFGRLLTFRMDPIGRVSLIRYPVSAHTSPTSTRRLKNARTNSSTTMPSVQKSNASSINHPMIPPNFPKQRKKPPWRVKSTKT